LKGVLFIAARRKERKKKEMNKWLAGSYQRLNEINPGIRRHLLLSGYGSKAALTSFTPHSCKGALLTFVFNVYLGNNNRQTQS